MRYNSYNTYPTVVIVTKAHQNPSPLPLTKDLGNSSGLYHVSYSKGECWSMACSLHEIRLQGIMVVVFIKTNIQSK